ncbi:MAG TPA: GNAT family N-acetyltransferase [Polyangiales bacterium]|nr:GNAT family N-acetyltransferase [Polyangiales bacterium]
MFEIRDATAADCGDMLTIYNEIVSTSTAIFSETPRSPEQQEYWFEDRTANDLPVLVAIEAGHIVGFGSYGQFRAWPGYRNTVENSIYLAPAARKRGYGTALLSALIERAARAKLHTMIAGIDGENLGSMRLHEKLGFTRAAHLKQVGRKFDRWLDLMFYQRML